jgi:hypothetical protein
MEPMFFTDAWFLVIWREFNPADYLVALALLVGLLKLWAKENPRVPTDKIFDLLALVFRVPIKRTDENRKSQ